MATFFYLLFDFELIHMHDFSKNIKGDLMSQQAVLKNAA